MSTMGEPQASDAEVDLPDNIPVVPTRISDPNYPSVLQSFGILLIFVACSIGAAPILVVIGPLDIEVAMLVYYLAAAGLSFAIVHSIRRRKLGRSTYRFQIDSRKLVLPLVLTSAALLFGVIGPLVSLIPMPREADQGFQKMMGQAGLATFLYFVIAAPVLEELLFRGIMLDGLLRRYRPVTAILVSSAIFGLAHLNPWQFVTALILGCFMGWVYLRTHSVGPCILIHMTANFSGYVVRLAYGGVDLSSQTQADGGGWGTYLVFPAICLTVIAVSVLYLRREFDRLEMASYDGGPAIDVA